jgi:hypothetical protein
VIEEAVVTRDMELLRHMLLAIEATPLPANLVNLTFEGYDFPTLAAHAELLVEAGLVEAEVAHGDGSAAPIYVDLHRITWQGYEFLDDARNPASWERVRALIAANTGTTSFAIIAELLKAAARSALTRPKT